jgi:urease accessory protein UreF
VKKMWKILVISAALAIILAAATAGTVLAVGSQENSYGCGAGIKGDSASDEVSKLLGLTPEQIQEQRQAGKSLVQIAATKNVNEETLIDAILAGKQETIQKMIKAGTLTQAQADQRLAQMRERIQLAVNRTTVGPPSWAGANASGQNGTGNGRGGMRQGGLRGNQQNCTGTPGTCTGTGSMMRAGRAVR